MTDQWFRVVVSRMKSALNARIKRGQRKISAVDLYNVQRSNVKACFRGAAVRCALTQLINEGVIKPTASFTYHPSRRQYVIIYEVIV